MWWPTISNRIKRRYMYKRCHIAPSTARRPCKAYSTNCYKNKGEPKVKNNPYIYIFENYLVFVIYILYFMFYILTSYENLRFYFIASSFTGFLF